MKANIDKIGTSYSASINGQYYKYGWYSSGKAFIANSDGELLSYQEAFRLFVPKHSYYLYDRFWVGMSEYRKSIDGIVRYLIATYNKD